MKKCFKKKNLLKVKYKCQFVIKLKIFVYQIAIFEHLFFYLYYNCFCYFFILLLYY